MLWKKEEIDLLWNLIPPNSKKNIRYFAEEHCLQFVSVCASKENGLKLLCEWTGIDLSEVAAAGDSKEDREMLNICGTSVEVC